MMFAEGTNKVECIRFSFGTVPCNYEEGPVGDPCSIDSTFCQDLHLNPGTEKRRLPIHVKRLETIQHVFDRKRLATDENHVKVLVLHWLAELTKALDESSSSSLISSTRVISVAGMDCVDVRVEVCNAYLRSQNKPDTTTTMIDEESGGKMVQLKIKSDLAVVSSPDRNTITDGVNASPLNSNTSTDAIGGKLLQDFLGCQYSIEITNTFEVLKGSAVPAKSRLIAQSLARSISRQSTTQAGLPPPQVLYSFLFDACCLHVLVHFPREERAFLSHREIEPGRITCVVAWLHLLSAREDLTVEQFRNFQGVTVGDTMQAEIKKASSEAAEQQPKGGGDEARAGTTDGTVLVPTKQPSGGSQNKRPLDTDEEMCFDFTEDENEELERKKHQQLVTFSCFQNYYRYGDHLPLTEDVLDEFHKDPRTGPTLSSAKLMARAGFQSIDNPIRSDGIA